MFRFANTSSKKENGELLDDIRFLEQEAGKTISSVIRRLYFWENGEPERESVWLFIGCMEEDFFSDLGEYFGGKDRDVSITFVGKKLQRMAQKMEDPEQAYTFDIFEEYLFNEMLAQFCDRIYDYPEEKEEYKKACRKRQEKVAKVLMDKYSYKKEKAKEMAKTVCRFNKTLPDWFPFDEDSLFFWDDDFALYFSEGFVEGIRKLTASGSMMGYDYASTCAIFTDAGYPVPLLLVGTEEASKVRNEATMERMREAMNATFSRADS